jgi:hypothetical protein
MSLPEAVTLAPVEDTYDDEHLAAVNAVQQGAPLGWVRSVENDRRNWQYGQAVESDLNAHEHPLRVTPVSDVQPSVTSSPIPGAPDKHVTWAKRTGPVLDQELTPHCVTFSGSSYRVEQERQEHRRTYHALAHQWYDETKALPDPWPGMDGTGIQYAAEVARTTGVAMDDPRSKRDDAAPRRFKIDSYAAITSVPEWLEALWKHGPVWFGTDVDRNIFTPRQVTDGPAKGDFVLDAPGRADMVGGHAMLTVGFWLSMGWLLVKQSWGESYGGVEGFGGGFFWMPLTYLANPDYTWDAWVVDDGTDFIRRPAT